MIIKISELINSYNLLSELDSKRLPIQVAWWVSKNIKLISYHYGFFISERNKLYTKYCEPDENNSYTKEIAGQILFNIKDGFQEVFINKMNELMNFEVELEPYLLDVDEVMNKYPDIQIEPKYFNRLGYLIKE